MCKKSLIRWTKYNHSILNGVLPGDEETSVFRRTISELSANNISSMSIAAFDDDCYLVEYLEGYTKKSMKILISEIETTKMKEVENAYP